MRLSAVVRLANFNANEQDVAMAMKTAPIEPNAKPKKWNDKFFTQGYTFWGADSLRTFNTQSRQGCQKVCRDNPVCTGVTYTTSCMRSAGCAKDTDLYMSPTHRIMGSDSRSEPRPQVVATVAASSTSSTSQSHCCSMVSLPGLGGKNVPTYLRQSEQHGTISTIAAAQDRDEATWLVRALVCTRVSLSSPPHCPACFWWQTPPALARPS